MAKAKYNPLIAFREDPLAALKLATDAARGVETLERLSTGADDTTIEIEASKRTSSDARSPSHPHPSHKSSAPVKPLSASLKTSRNTVYLYPEDLTKLRQLSGYASTEHGIRANDSMIVRAALSLLEADVRLLHALKETELLDRRRRGRPE